jgi:HPt (histidine-containing phosphotransfer) domain-containing protein
MEVPVELKRKYLERRIQDLRHLRSLLEIDDYSEALRLGHQVKGNAVTFDFPQIVPFGIAIENAAKIKDKLEIQFQITKMEHALHDARQLVG